MSNKLQELTDRLYQEGLSKGKAEGEEILRKAREEAAGTIADATEKANEIIAKAGKEADALRSKAQSDIKMASEQSLSATRKDIENLIVASIADSKIDSVLGDEKFIREIIGSIARGFNSAQAQDLNLILPEKLKAATEQWVKTELSTALGKEVHAEFSKKITGGFTIGPKDGSYFVSFSDETFKELIGEYLRPVTRKILFGE